MPDEALTIKQMLEAFTGTMGRDDLLAAIGLEERRSFSERYLRPAIAAGLVEMTIPPRRDQKGRAVTVFTESVVVLDGRLRGIHLYPCLFWRSLNIPASGAP